MLALRVCRTARQPSKLPDEVRFLGGALKGNTSLECAGLARDPAKVEDQVRFLARTLENVALEPNGKAAACKAASSGFDSHRRLLGSKIRLAQRRTPHCPPAEAVGDVRSAHGFRRMSCHSEVSSMAEHQLGKLAVTGSTPVPPRGRKPAPTRPEGGGPTSDRPPAARIGVSFDTRPRGWQHVRAPCSAWIPLPRAIGQAAVDVRRLAPGLAPATTSRTEAAVQPTATRMLKRHSALVRVIAAGSAARRLFCSD